jgi:hypothetical protein
MRACLGGEAVLDLHHQRAGAGSAVRDVEALDA